MAAAKVQAMAKQIAVITNTSCITNSDLTIYLTHAMANAQVNLKLKQLKLALVSSYAASSIMDLELKKCQGLVLLVRIVVDTKKLEVGTVVDMVLGASAVVVVATGRLVLFVIFGYETLALVVEDGQKMLR